MSQKKPLLDESARKRIQRLQERMTAVDLVCSGTLLERTKVCGKPECRCAHDPSARHGPYFEWTRREDGRLVHKLVPRSQAKALARAIRNFRAVQAHLARWERESARWMRSQMDATSKKTKS